MSTKGYRTLILNRAGPHGIFSERHIEKEKVGWIPPTPPPGLLGCHVSGVCHGIKSVIVSVALMVKYYVFKLLEGHDRIKQAAPDTMHTFPNCVKGIYLF